MKRASAAPRHRRRQLLVNPALQYQFIGVMLFVLLLLTIAALGGVYFALWLILRTYQLAEDPIAVAQFTTVGLVITFEMLVIAPLVVWIGLRMTHRVAGPLVRINAVLQRMAAGDYSQHITLRKGDSMVELAEAINALSSSLRSRLS